MPLSMSLPHWICYPATLAARRAFPPVVEQFKQDQASYFERQRTDTVARFHQHMRGLDVAGKTVLDVGCGLGGRALGWLELGAIKVLNVDINRQELEAGKAMLESRFPDRIGQVIFRHVDEMAEEAPADLAILFDSFEHFSSPLSVLNQVDQYLKPGGQVWIGSIGWYNYMASHCTNSHIPIPWCQLIFSERAIIKSIQKLLRRPDYQANIWEKMEGLDRWDKVTTLKDRPGEPLNMLSLRKIKMALRESPFRLREFRVFGFTGRRHKFSRYLATLSQLPIFDELLHTYYTALLEKPLS